MFLTENRCSLPSDRQAMPDPPCGIRIYESERIPSRERYCGTSKIQFQSELHDAWIAHARNCTESPKAVSGIKTVGVGVVEHIESLGAKLRVEAIIRF